MRTLLRVLLLFGSVNSFKGSVKGFFNASSKGAVTGSFEGSIKGSRFLLKGV